MSGVKGIAHPHVEREVLVALEVVTQAGRGVETLVVDEGGTHLEAHPGGVLALVLEAVATLGIEGNERVAPAGVVGFGLGLVGALRIGLEDWLEAVQTNSGTNEEALDELELLEELEEELLDELVEPTVTAELAVPKPPIELATRTV